MTAVLERPAETTVVRYEPRGAARQLMTIRDDVVLMCGPAGTGKSLAALWKLHLTALQQPNLRGLIVRQTHASLTGTTLVTFDEEVIAANLANGDVKWFGGSARKPPAYIYANGSTITIGGLDKPIKWMGGQYDRVVVDEATEISTTALEALITRMRAKAKTFKQIILCCNPDHPKHWLNTRAHDGGLPMLHSRHQDNPRYFRRVVEPDGRERFELTDEGRDYIEGKLGKLTGVRRLRLLLGQWAAAEGVVYEDFDANAHCIDAMPAGWETWTRWWSVDFGYSNPFVCQFWAQDGDGRLYLYREIYMTRRLVEDHARQILGIVAPGGSTNDEGVVRQGKWLEPKPRAVICDHDAEGRATFERHLGMTTKPARKAPTAGQRDLVGLQAAQARYKVQPDGKPRIFYVRGCTVEVDQELKNAGLPTSTVDEITSYVWPPDVKPDQREHPVKENDHGCFVAGTLVETETGPRPIERVAPGDRVWTRAGLRMVLDAGMTDAAAEVCTLPLPGGRSLVGTGNHPVWTGNRGWVRLDALRYNDMLVTWPPKSLCSGESDSVATQTAATGQTGRTTGLALPTGSVASRTYTWKSGKPPTGPSPTAAKSTTPTSIRSTTTSATSSASPSPRTRPPTDHAARNARSSPTTKLTSTVSGRSPRNGTGPTLVANGTVSTLVPSASAPASRVTAPASSAAPPTKPPGRAATGSARTAARRRGDERAASTTSSGRAVAAAPSSRSTGTPESSSAHGDALRATASVGHAAVYNLTVDGEHEYFANGVLVHNCDAKRYLIAELDKGQTKWMRWVK